MQSLKTVQASAKPALKSGPSLLEIEYLRQLLEDLSIFLRGSNCTTLKDIVIGVRGETYQGVISIKDKSQITAI
jgi:hypothetical protein